MMIKQKQLFRHNPAAGIYGDCCRTCYACLLDLPVEKVPHFLERNPVDVDALNADIKSWLESVGYREIICAYINYDTIDELLTLVASQADDCFYLIGGSSRTGCNHSVIGHRDKIYWDPALNDSGIIGPLDNDQYQISFLIPLALTSTAIDD